jgi:hypothetical protein
MSPEDRLKQLDTPAAPTAPRVTPADIEAEIVGEYYFTGENGVIGAIAASIEAGQNDPREPAQSRYDALERLSLLTFCVLRLRNGCLVVGKSAVISPENFDAAKGREVARKNAIDQVWQLLGFRLLDRLAGTEAARIADLEAVIAEQDRRLAAMTAARYL